MVNEWGVDAETLDDVEGELGELIQDEGLTEIRVSQCATVLGTLYRHEDPTYLITLIRMEMIGMTAVSKGDKNAVALDAAFGGTYKSPVTLTERRSKYLADNPDLEISIDTLRRWERKAMKLLAHKLVFSAPKTDEAARKLWENINSTSTDPDVQSDIMKTRVERLEKQVEDLAFIAQGLIIELQKLGAVEDTGMFSDVFAGLTSAKIRMNNFGWANLPKASDV